MDAQWRAITYEYDSNNRLAATRYTGNDEPPITYTYDLDGNQTAACNQLGCIRNRKIRVLASGATETTSYRYDREDRLVGVSTTISDASSVKQTLDASYTYDAYGRRATKNVRYPTAIMPTQVLTYTYDGLDIIGTQLQRSGVVTTTQFYLAPSPITGLRRAVAMERLSNANTGFAGDRSWYQTDGLDSVVALTDASGTIASALLYDEYGQRLAGSGDLALFTFTAQDEDTETGLIHFYARSYDPATGTWLTQDKYRGQIAAPGTLHRYGYVGANPGTWWDVYGYAIYVPGRWTTGPKSGVKYHYEKHVLGLHGRSRDLGQEEFPNQQSYDIAAARLLNIFGNHSFLTVTDCRGHFGQLSSRNGRSCSADADWEVIDANESHLAAGEERTGLIRTMYRPTEAYKIEELMEWDYPGAWLRAGCKGPVIKPNLNYATKPNNAIQQRQNRNYSPATGCGINMSCKNSYQPSFPSGCNINTSCYSPVSATPQEQNQDSSHTGGSIWKPIAGGVFIGGAAVLTVATIVEDFGTGFVGVADDGFSFATAAKMIQQGSQMIQQNYQWSFQ